ncbi:MAG: HD domain-containing protein, partial [bacterium]|nr:HD domain-containing protein [bacterium]
ILKKPGKLTSEEFDHIKQHVVTTRKILEKMHFMPKYSDVPLIASCHHERLDGSGYCGGLKSAEIPFAAKIIAVADVFEALTARRHYRDALPLEDAFKILEQGIGSQFDGNIVMALKRYLDRRS